MSSEKVKIEVELDHEQKIAIDIIVKAFNWTPEQFIQYVIKNNIKYIKDTFERDCPSDLREQYNTGVDMNELKKLTLVEEIL